MALSDDSGTAVAQPALRLADDGELLVPGRHRATLEQIYDLFVLQAPFADDRQVIWEAFDLYQRNVARLLPNSKLWVDGGFVTHKRWAPPNDVDVCIIASTEEVAAAGPALLPLLTDTSGPKRVQPMSGMVDGFITVPRPHPDSNSAYWAHQWSRVRDLNGNEDESRRKGYVEVVSS
ncbi:DUF6932 family protein [Oerskovia jenensis]|uniref:DUF6932 family protein n=1 Tax=Oerskovia jenensis TaxID=162169 RepID=UPI0036DE002A